MTPISATANEFWVSRICFVVAGIALLAAYFYWIHEGDRPHFVRVIWGVVAGILSIVGTTECVLWVNNKERILSEKQTSKEEKPIRSLRVLSRVNPWDYPPGTEIAGIKWRQGFSDLRVFISNTTSAELTNVDVLVQPEIKIAKAGLMSDFVTGKTAPAHRIPTPIPLSTVDGKTMAMPPETGDMNELLMAVYRTHYDKFPPNTDAEIVLATCNISEKPMGSLFSDVRKDPKWVIVRASYQVGGNRIEENFEIPLTNKP